MGNRQSVSSEYHNNIAVFLPPSHYGLLGVLNLMMIFIIITLLQFDSIWSHCDLRYAGNYHRKLDNSRANRFAEKLQFTWPGHFFLRTLWLGRWVVVRASLAESNESFGRAGPVGVCLCSINRSSAPSWHTRTHAHPRCWVGSVPCADKQLLLLQR